MHLRAGVMRSIDNGLTWHNGGDTDAHTIASGRRRLGNRRTGHRRARRRQCLYADANGRRPFVRGSQHRSGQDVDSSSPQSIAGQQRPAALCRFQVGQRRGILCVWDNAIERFPLCAAVSFDDCRLWSTPKDIAGPTDGLQASYPSCDQAADGALVAVWQQQTAKGWDVRCARFDLDWLLQN